MVRRPSHSRTRTFSPV
ncbi:hypothetical protein LINPERPRIM_LOCUS40500 [Linum perenne]